MLKFYGYKKCDTCRKAEKALAKLGREYEFIDITLDPPAQASLKKMVGQSGAELKKVLQYQRRAVQGVGDQGQGPGHDGTANPGDALRQRPPAQAPDRDRRGEKHRWLR
jgi:glutaredoxin